MALFAAIAWLVWYHRNKVCLDDASMPLEIFFGFALDYIQDFNKLVKVPPSICRSVPKKWCRFVSILVKINFDGAMFGESDEAGLRVVIRNSKSEVLAALSEKIQKPTTVEVLELLAAKRAVSFSLETGFTKSVFEGDSESVIRALRCGGWENSHGGHLINDILFSCYSVR